MKRPFTRLAPSEEPAARTDADTFRFVFSNESVGRDGHVVLNKGIQTANYLRNPIILFAHDDGQPPIGRGSNIDTLGVNCRMDVTFAPRDALPFAGTIRDLVAGKWLRALSMSWQPIEWKYSNDKNRAGGIDFTKVDLLEVSVVPLPALPDALLDARSHGINIRPLYDWAERALDTPHYDRVPRQRLEAICRAARSLTPVRDRDQLARRLRENESSDRRARLAKIRELEDKWDRMERARRLAAGERAHYASADRTELKRAQQHQQRSAKHHQAVSEQHAGQGEQIERLRTIHERATKTLSELGIGKRATTQTLSELGIRMARQLDALNRCIRSMGDTHEDQQDSLLNLGHSLSKATECVSNVLDENEPYEPAGVGS